MKTGKDGDPAAFMPQQLERMSFQRLYKNAEHKGSTGGGGKLLDP